jgi:hypothetical protein
MQCLHVKRTAILEHMTEETSDKSVQPKKTRRTELSKVEKYILLVIFAVIAIAGIFVAYAYASTPEVVRHPKLEHYHFRMQILVNGKAENFGSKAYQQGYSKDNCNADLPEQPIHFHDNKDQFVHIHWKGMTGGMVLKYFGWNYIGGMNGALGYKIDSLTDPQRVSIHGNYLPTVPKDAKFYVYTGDETGYKERGFEDWKNQDLEKFFGKASNLPANQTQSSFLNLIFPRVAAHSGEVHVDGNETEQQRLTRINNLIGNVVIFAQDTKPSDQQVKARFNQLVPLSDSTCGG